MKPIFYVGILLIAIGAYVMVQGGSVKTREDVLKVGDLKVSTTENHAIPPWAGGAGILIGVVLVVSGAKKR